MPISILCVCSVCIVWLLNRGVCNGFTVHVIFGILSCVFLFYYITLILLIPAQGLCMQIT